MARRALPALFGAACCGALALLVYYLAFHVVGAQWQDAAAQYGFTRLNFTRVAPFAELVARLANPVPFAFGCAVVVLVALRARGLAAAVVISAVLVGANLVTQYLKPALAAPRPYMEGGIEVAAASWPSGHATASMVLALCAVLAAPDRRRLPVAVLGALYALGVSYSVVLLTWHFPSDVVGGFAVAGAATCLGVAALRSFEGRREIGRVPPALLAAGGVVALGSGVAVAKVLRVMPDPDLERAFLIGGAGIAGLGLLLAVGLAASLRA